MANWWELWSPGLQAVGGIVEFIGVGFLSYEWLKSLRENRKRQQFIFAKLARKNHNFIQKAIPSLEMDPFKEGLTRRILERLPKTSPDDEENLEVNSAHAIYQRLWLYRIGFALIALGVLAQVGANWIAWAAAYGLFR